MLTHSRWLSHLGLIAMTVARLALGIGMIPYGLSKLLQFQFQVSAWDYTRPLGEIPGTTLTWAFLGHSPSFQVLLGLLETVPALLLLCAGTRRLGALLLFPVMLNVTFINFFFDLWPTTKIISVVLLALNTFLILYDLPIYLHFLSRLLVRPTPIQNARFRTTTKVAGFVVPAVLIGLFLYNFRSQVNAIHTPITDFIGQRQINRAGSWQISSIQISGREITSTAPAFLYFDFGHRCVYASGEKHHRGQFTANRARHIFQIKGISLDGRNDAIDGTYQVNGETLLLHGTQGSHPIDIILHRTQWGHGPA